MRRFLINRGIKYEKNFFIRNFISCTQYKPAPIDYDSLSKNLTTGMSKTEVIKILGLPKNKSIDGNKETYYYSSIAESSVVPKLLSRTVFIPFGILTGRDMIKEKLGTSEITLEFDENGKLEKFN